MEIREVNNSHESTVFYGIPYCDASPHRLRQSLHEPSVPGLGRDRLLLDLARRRENFHSNASRGPQYVHPAVSILLPGRKVRDLSSIGSTAFTYEQSPSGTPGETRTPAPGSGGPALYPLSYGRMSGDYTDPSSRPAIPILPKPTKAESRCPAGSARGRRHPS